MSNNFILFGKFWIIPTDIITKFYQASLSLEYIQVQLMQINHYNTYPTKLQKYLCDPPLIS